MASQLRDTREPPSKRMRILKKGLFAKDLAPMMYGFGDSEHPSPDTISVVEELLVEHITDVCTQAHRISTNRGKIKVDDFKFALRKDPIKLARVEELLFMSEVIARARGKDDVAAFAEEEREREREAGPALGAAAAAAAVVEPPQPVAVAEKRVVDTKAGADGPPKKKKKSKKDKGKEKAPPPAAA